MLRLNSLRAQEDKLYDKAIEIVTANKDLQLHINIIICAMDLADILQQHKTDDQDFKVIQLLGMRTFNAFGASYKLALSGYSQNSAMIMRDIMETAFLLSLFQGEKSLITKWRTSDKKTQKKFFSPVKVREALDKRDGFKSKKRAEIYKAFSELACHPNMNSQFMMQPEKGGDIVMGPFIEETSLKATLDEMGRLAVQVGTTLNLFCPDHWQDAVPKRKEFNRSQRIWFEKFYPV